MLWVEINEQRATNNILEKFYSYTRTQQTILHLLLLYLQKFFYRNTKVRTDQIKDANKSRNTNRNGK